jgi:hypothetical protein
VLSLLAMLEWLVPGHGTRLASYRPIVLSRVPTLHDRPFKTGLLKMTDFSCGLILPKISQQPARQPVAGRPAEDPRHADVTGFCTSSYWPC